MARRFMIATGFTLMCIASSLLAQSSEQDPRVTVALPEGVSSENVSFHYVLYGSFGAAGGSADSKPDSRFVQIQTSSGGKAASEIRIFVWAPGCKIVTFNIPLNEASDVHESFQCSFLPAIKLEGQIQSAGLQRNPNTEVSVTYLAHWSCRFFGLADCMVPMIHLGTATPDANGFFSIEIPDFSSDSITRSSADGAELDLLLREAKTWNHIARIQPESKEFRSPGGGLKIESSYPRNMPFAALKPN